jgi:Tfp pilus assembly protein PilZ
MRVAESCTGVSGLRWRFAVADGRVAKRHKWRLPCEIVSEGRSQRAIVLDLSESGLFVQTGTRLPPGVEVEVRVRLADSAETVLLRAQVARNKQVPPQLTSVARGGVGLRILDAPLAYYEQVNALDNVAGDGVRPVGAAAPVAAPSPAPPQNRFRVRVKQSDGPRSRSLEILANSADEARTRALSDAGVGWEAVAVEAIA